MRTIGKHENTIFIIVVSLISILLLIYALYSQRELDNFNNIIHNPTFTGMVVGAERSMERITMIGTRFPVYRLHVIGEYIKGDEIIQVDRIFVVPEEMFNQFEIGDTIIQQTP